MCKDVKKNGFAAISLAVLMMFSASKVTASTQMPPHLVGEGIYSVVFWDVYQAQLYAKSPYWNPTSRYALKLTYFREFKGQDIAERSIEEIKGLGYSNPSKLNTWLETMQKLFPDVAKNDSLTGVRQDNGSTAFFHNDQSLGSIKDPEFAKWFFGIWLHENTSAPKLRAQLLGQQ